MRKVTATRRAKESWERDSWMRPKREAESGGTGREDIVPPGGRGFFGVSMVVKRVISCRRGTVKSETGEGPAGVMVEGYRRAREMVKLAANRTGFVRPRVYDLSPGEKFQMSRLIRPFAVSLWAYARPPQSCSASHRPLLSSAAFLSLFPQPAYHPART